jgi:thiamine-phosphate pyrophosphorylase
MTKRSVLRIVDANANRALEGIRVCEDIVRFHLEAPDAFRRLRALRHAVARTVRRLPVRAADLARSRNSRQDPGKRAPASRVESLGRLLVINLQRTKESLRTLEECARLVAPRQTPDFARLRFRTYEVERDLLINLSSLRHH